eukprot:660679-Hanusia_phi.AAC.2
MVCLFRKLPLDGEEKNLSGMKRKRGMRIRFQIVVLLVAWMVPGCTGADGYIELTKDGFRVSDMVTMQKVLTRACPLKAIWC